MARIGQYQVEITGRPEGPAFNNWYVASLDLSTPVNQNLVDVTEAALAVFYSAIAAFIPGDVVYRFSSLMDDIDDATGAIQGVVAGSGVQASVAGTSTGNQVSKATAVKLQTRTGVYRDGSELRGGVYLSPLGGNAVSTLGDTSDAAINTIEAAAATLGGDLNAAGASLIVWRRPRPTSAALPARAGSSALVTRVTVGSKLAVLRSRRD